MDGAQNPFKVHPGNLLAKHPPEAVGCTMCHQGQGLATTKDDAHGNVPHWDKPLLTGHFVQASCTKCHHEDEVPQAPVLSRGKHLLHELGCVGCHRTGDGADDEKVGPRLAVIGSKVSRPWLNKWLHEPQGLLAQGPDAAVPSEAPGRQRPGGLPGDFRDKSIDASPGPKGDHDAGEAIFRRLQCITCHVTQGGLAGEPHRRHHRSRPAKGGKQGQQALVEGLLPRPARLLSAHQDAPFQLHRAGGGRPGGLRRRGVGRLRVAGGRERKKNLSSGSIRRHWSSKARICSRNSTARGATTFRGRRASRLAPT